MVLISHGHVEMEFRVQYVAMGGIILMQVLRADNSGIALTVRPT